MDEPSSSSRSSSISTDLLTATSSSLRTPRLFDRFDSSSDSSPSSSPSSATATTAAAAKKLDYMIQFLDRKLSSTAATTTAPLPEFIAAGNGKVPPRSAARGDIPVSVEVRPRPLRETQVGKGLKTVVCAAERGELWCGGEIRVRVWELGKLGLGLGLGGEGKLGDEMTARYKEMRFMETGEDGGEEVLSMVVDEAGAVVWSGHRDGKIRCWRNGDVFSECLSWQAHRGPVFSLVLTSYGELFWCGSVKFV